jgi:hypothetical protein
VRPPGHEQFTYAGNFAAPCGIDREVRTREMDELTQSLGHRCPMALDQFPGLSEPTKLQAIEDFVKNRLGKSDTELAAQIAKALLPHARRELALWFKQ